MSSKLGDRPRTEMTTLVEQKKISSYTYLNFSKYIITFDALLIRELLKLYNNNTHIITLFLVL